MKSRKHKFPIFWGQEYLQLHIPSWKRQLEGYCDTQLLDLLQYGFLLGFNRSCVLKNDVVS